MGKNKLLTIAQSITLVLAMASCTNKHPYQVRQDCYAAIESYVACHKEYTSFLLLSTRKLFNEDGNHPGFLIGPLYKGLDKELKDFALTDFLEVDAKKRFISFLMFRTLLTTITTPQSTIANPIAHCY